MTKIPSREAVTSLVNQASQLAYITEQLNQVLLGKPHVVKQVLACLLAGGHLLIEDLPGLGKTTLSKSLAKVFALEFSRVQFTSDLLPADLLGTNIFDQRQGEFCFRKGPIFTQILLADEINRAPARTQSALLESMAEGQVSIDGEAWSLPAPFSVIATQNPQDQAGTYPLPESQLDRFMMQVSFGYPSAEAELIMLSQERRGFNIAQIAVDVIDVDLLALQGAAQQVQVSKAVLTYIVRIAAATREQGGELSLAYGLSPRGSKALLSAAKAWAFLEGRDYVMPDDVQDVAIAVIAHRLPIADRGQAQQWVKGLLARVAVVER